MFESELLRINSPDDSIINKSNSTIILNSSPGSKSNNNGKVAFFNKISQFYSQFINNFLKYL